MTFDELDDDDGPPADSGRRARVVARARQRQGRRRAMAAFAALAVLTPLTLVAVNGDDDPDRVRLATEPDPALTTTSTLADSLVPFPTTEPTLTPPTLTVTIPPTTPDTPTTTQPAGTARRPVVADRAGRWKLAAFGEGPKSCLELVAGEKVHGPLLCGSGRATSVVGDVVTLDTPAGRMAVAVVDPTVTGFAAYPQGPGRLGLLGEAGTDPTPTGLTYAAGEIGAAGVTSQLVIAAGVQTPAKVTLPAANGPIPAGSVDITTSGPYGVWPGYRRAGLTGFVFGGNQEVGFYDGPGGRPCLLYRRFTGPAERLLIDQCAARDAYPSDAFAELLPAGVANFEQYFLTAVVSDVPVTSWRCELSTGELCTGTQLYADPKGSGRTFLYTFAGLHRLPLGSTLTAVVLDGQREVARYERKAF